ncbi:MAG: hypothetical protein ACE15E_08260 [Acidobacteriota bacterium]
MITVWQFERILARPFEWVLSPFADTHPLAPLALVSLIASIVLLLAFRWLSDQPGLQQIKGKIHAHFLELRLFRHDAGVIWFAEKQILRYNLVYLTYLIKPLVVTLPIFVLFLVELDAWFSSRPLGVGEPVVVSVFAQPGAVDVLHALRIANDGGLRVETPALRIPEERRADWRIRALAAGEHRLRFLTGRQDVTKRLRVGRERLVYVAVTRSAAGWFSGFVNSEEPPLSPDNPISRIEVNYPRSTMSVWGWSVNWAVAFIVLSLVFAYLLKRPFGLVL